MAFHALGWHTAAKGLAALPRVSIFGGKDVEFPKNLLEGLHYIVVRGVQAEGGKGGHWVGLGKEVSK